MKKIIFGIAAFSMLTMNSCKDNDGTSTMSYPVSTYNLVTPYTGDTDPIVNAATYKFNFDLMAQTVAVSTELALSTSGVTSFVTNNIGYTGGLYQLNEAVAEDVLTPSGEIINIKANTAGTTNTSLDVTDFQCLLTVFPYIPPTVDGIEAVSCPYGYEYAVMSYNLGDRYQVRSFWPDVTFKGSTTTHYPYGTENKTFTNKDVLYRVKMDLEKKTATVIMYNALLAEEMPKAISNIVLKNLPVVFSNQGYSINAENVVPEVYEAGTATPNTRFVFNNFSLVVEGDLTEAAISYKVANVYEGNFTGSYIVKFSTTK